MMVEDEALRPVLQLTDVVKPGMSGSVLAARFKQVRPGTKVLHKSWYTDEAIVQYDVVAPQAQYIRKPFCKLALSYKMREVLTRESNQG